MVCYMALYRLYVEDFGMDPEWAKACALTCDYYTAMTIYSLITA